MSRFRDLLQQLEECHDAEIARLQGQHPVTTGRRGAAQDRLGVSPERSLLGSMVRCACWTPVAIPLPRPGPRSLPNDRETAEGSSPPFREAPATPAAPSDMRPSDMGPSDTGTRAAATASVSRPAATPSAPDEPSVPFTCTFGEDVQQLGFRIKWTGDRPTIQTVDSTGHAYRSGVREADTIVAINGTDTERQARDDLLPLLRDRPLKLIMFRETKEEEQPSPAASSRDVADVTIEVPNAAEDRFRETITRTASFGMAAGNDFGTADGNGFAIADSNDMQELMQQFSSGNLRRESTTQAKLGLKRYVEEEDVKETMVSKTVRLFTGPEVEKTPETGLISKVRRTAVDFAEWWDALVEPERTGRAQDALESRWFRIMSALVIVVNAIVVTWLTDWSLEHSGRNMPPGFELVDLAFLLFYAMEIILKFYVHQGYFFANENAAWNLFDLMLVIFSSFDVAANWPSTSEDETPPNNLGYMRVFRMFKFAKILRTIRIIAFVRELSMMLESFRQCVIAMFWGLVLLLFLLYVFALVFAQGVASHVATAIEHAVPDSDVMQAFGSVGQSMLSLYMAVTGGNDWSVYYSATMTMGSFYPIVFLSYTFFFIFALFNILTGVFVERAVAAALPDREELIAQERKKILKQVDDLRGLFKALDQDGSGKISKAEFLADMADDRIVSYMHTLGLDMHDAEHFFDLVANSTTDKEVDIDTFIEHCMSMKGTATAMDLHKQMVQVNKVLDKLTAWERLNWPALFEALQEEQERKRC